MTNPWTRFREGVDGDEVARKRSALEENRAWDEGDACFVALTECLQEEIRSGDTRMNLLAQGLDWGDNLVSFVLDVDQRDRRCEAMAWALAEVLPFSKHRWQKKDVVRLMDQRLQVDEEYKSGPVCRALLWACAEHPKDVGGEAWKWLSANLPACVAAGVVEAEEARRVLTLGHAGSTKRVVAEALEALGGPLQEAGAKASPKASGQARPTLASVAAEMGCAAPAPGEAVLLEGEDDVLLPPRLAHLGPSITEDCPSAGDAKRWLSGRKRLDKAATEAIGGMGIVRGEWMGARLRAWRKRGEWLVVRLDRIVSPHDEALAEPEFTPDVLLDDFFGTMFEDREEATVAFVATDDAVLGLYWRGPEFYAGLDPSQADEQHEALYGW